MRYLLKLSGLAVVLVVLFTACNKKETKVADVEGVYEGTLNGLLTKSSDGLTENIPATTKISQTGENEIQVHCYSENFDTTFMMNYYMDDDSAFVCYTGDNFEGMYGHMLGEGHNGGMMDDMHESETEWMHHMDEEHDEGDGHFGGFDMTNHSFSYTFQMKWNDTSDNLNFLGIKQ
jgi:hypothetical protein